MSVERLAGWDSQSSPCHPEGAPATEGSHAPVQGSMRSFDSARKLAPLGMTGGVARADLFGVTGDIGLLRSAPGRGVSAWAGGWAGLGERLVLVAMLVLAAALRIVGL